MPKDLYVSELVKERPLIPKVVEQLCLFVILTSSISRTEAESCGIFKIRAGSDFSLRCHWSLQEFYTSPHLILTKPNRSRGTLCGDEQTETLEVK